MSPFGPDHKPLRDGGFVWGLRVCHISHNLCLHCCCRRNLLPSRTLRCRGHSQHSGILRSPTFFQSDFQSLPSFVSFVSLLPFQSLQFLKVKYGKNAARILWRGVSSAPGLPAYFDPQVASLSLSCWFQPTNGLDYNPNQGWTRRNVANMFKPTTGYDVHRLGHLSDTFASVASSSSCQQIWG